MKEVCSPAETVSEWSGILGSLLGLHQLRRDPPRGFLPGVPPSPAPTLSMNLTLPSPSPPPLKPSSTQGPISNLLPQAGFRSVAWRPWVRKAVSSGSMPY